LYPKPFGRTVRTSDLSQSGLNWLRYPHGETEVNGNSMLRVLWIGKEQLELPGVR